MLMTLLLPFVCTLIPLFILYKHVGWIGCYLPLEVPTFFGSSVFSTFLLRQFFMTIPQSLSDAARVDGASEFYIYSRIILPLAKPAMATVILFQFIYCWNDFLGPLIYISNQNSVPALARPGPDPRRLHDELVVGDGRRRRRPPLPIVILFFLTQRTFIQGIALTGNEVMAGQAGDPQAARHLRPGVMAALASLFNFLALNLVLLIASLPVITLPLAVNAASVALDRWRADGEDRVVREFWVALRSRPPLRTTVALGVPFAAIGAGPGRGPLLRPRRQPSRPTRASASAWPRC